MARDRTLLALAADALRGTAEFARVTTCGPPEDVGDTSEHLKLAGLELSSFSEDDLTGEPLAASYRRTVQFLLHLHVRHPDPDARDDELDRLSQVAANALTGQSFGGVAFAHLTRLSRGQYLAAEGVERRLRILGQFSYEVADPNSRDAAS